MRFGYTFVWVDDVCGAVAWFDRALGIGCRVLRDNGPLGGYAELDTGDTALAIADTREARVLFPDGFRPLDAREPAPRLRLRRPPNPTRATIGNTAARRSGPRGARNRRTAADGAHL